MATSTADGSRRRYEGLSKEALEPEAGSHQRCG
jgi:hypothetical protein